MYVTDVYNKWTIFTAIGNLYSIHMHYFDMLTRIGTPKKQDSIKYLTLVYIMAKNINYHIYKPQIIFPPLLSVYNYFFEFSHCLLAVSFSTSYRLKTPYT